MLEFGGRVRAGRIRCGACGDRASVVTTTRDGEPLAFCTLHGENHSIDRQFARLKDVRNAARVRRY
jgi:hypothetical protein